MNRNIFSVSIIFLLTFQFSQAQSVTTSAKARIGYDRDYYAAPVLVGLPDCSVSGRSEVTCTFLINLDSDKDTPLRLSKDYSFQAIFTDGKRYSPNKISLSSYNNGVFTDERIDTKLSPKIDYKIQLKFTGIESPLNKISYLDVGTFPDDMKWVVRRENVAIRNAPLAQPPTPLPAPQAALTPKQYMTFNATNGYGTLSGVSLNGGLYDVNLQGCRPTDGGMAACTLTLTPMRATAQDVTLEDLNVAVNGAAVVATATATPTVMTLTVTAPVNVNRIDELRLGNARFLNVGVK